MTTPALRAACAPGSPQPAARSPQPAYYTMKINQLRLFFGALLAAVLGLPFTASAALNGCQTLDMSNPGAWGTTIRDVFIAPEGFDTLPVGEPVSLVRWFGMQINCTITNTTQQYGIGMATVPNASNVAGMPNTFTTPQLQSRGLGYRVIWYAYTDQSTTPNPVTTPERTLTTVTQTTQPIHWLTPSQAIRNSQFIQARADAGLQFVKINNNISDTSGASTPVNISTELVRFYLADRAAPANTSRNAPFVWNTSTFVSKVRACTPTVLGPNPNFVNLGTIVPTGIPANGTTLTQSPFSLTFNCPYMAFERIGFTFQPVYGLVPGSQNIMQIEPGDGMATGVGIRLNMDMTGSWSVVNYNQNYYIPDFQQPGWFNGVTGERALNDSKTRTIHFNAEVVRTPGPFSPGKMKSALIIVMKYK